MMLGDRYLHLCLPVWCAAAWGIIVAALLLLWLCCQLCCCLRLPVKRHLCYCTAAERHIRSVAVLWLYVEGSGVQHTHGSYAVWGVQHHLQQRIRRE